MLRLIFIIILLVMFPFSLRTGSSYDEHTTPLSIPLSSHSVIYPTDCRITLTHCSKHADCQPLCLESATCNENVCTYVETDDYCLNGGSLITYFWQNQKIKTCVCDQKGLFFGPRCDKPNPFLPREW